MDEDGVAYVNAGASANGLLHCLRFLAQEAASLNLRRTLTAIEDALETALFESDTALPREGCQHGSPMQRLN